MHKTGLEILIPAFMALVLACSCGQPAPEIVEKKSAQTQTPAPSIPSADELPVTIGIAHNYFAHPYSQAILREIDVQAAKYPDVIKEIRWTNAQGSSSKQIANIEDLIAAGVKLIILDPWEGDALMPAMRKLWGAGIPVVLIDRKVPTDNYMAYVSGSNVECGELVALHIARKLKDKFGTPKGNVIELYGTLGATAFQDRHDGFMKAMGQYPDINVLSSPEVPEGKDQAMRVMEDIMTRFPVIDAVYGHNDDRAIGAYEVAENYGREKGLICVGIDGMKETYESIAAGKISATMVYPPCGTKAVDLAVQILKNEPVPHDVFVPIKEINAENVEHELNVAQSYLEGIALDSPRWGK
jgi:ribose transport system substrate-binding protein